MAPRAPARPLPNDRQRQHADFIQRFTQQESERRIAKRLKALTAAQHATLREQLKEVHFLKPDYADNTKINITGMLRKWKRYYESAKLVGSCIKSWGTSWEYFRRYIDRNDSREILKWHDTVLIPRFDLQAPNSGGKDTFNIAYDTSICSWERHRMNLSGCYLGLAFTGARPAEFVDGEKKTLKDGCLEELFGPKPIGGSFSERDEDEALDENFKTVGRGRLKCLCYEDILLMVVRYPETGEDVHVMLIKFIHYKGADNKLKPRLIFCLITVIVSLTVHDRAFAAPSLIIKCTPFRWKKEWLKRPPIELKAWRRGAVNAANSNAPDAVRDQMMHHDPKWATFNILDEPTEDSLIGMLSYISLMHDPRAHKDMVPDEREYRADYFHNRPTWEIERQASGEEEEEYIEPAINLHIPEHLSSIKLLELRIQAGELMVVLAPVNVMVKEESPEPDPFPLLMDKAQCLDCIGDERLLMQERTFVYCRPAVRNDHWDKEHREEKKRAA
ncbi:FluG domain-containing protein [Diplogelasinospora grovesii]|uniref:FluG domain-containing protein n=1 Tax=Diplogelasinospora grovesii TaxID=303347 RepID=A0AAN6NGA0_9PEZI|nr:FluG domain-containing protein [Diplogelasinospora grovesii]